MVTSGLRLSPRVCVVNLIYQAVPFTSHWYVKKCAINHTLIVQTWAQSVPSLFMLKLKTYLANSCSDSFAPNAHMFRDLKLNSRMKVSIMILFCYKKCFQILSRFSQFAICAYFLPVGPSVYVYNGHKSVL